MSYEYKLQKTFFAVAEDTSFELHPFFNSIASLIIFLSRKAFHDTLPWFIKKYVEKDVASNNFSRFFPFILSYTRVLFYSLLRKAYQKHATSPAAQLELLPRIDHGWMGTTEGQTFLTGDIIEAR